MRRANEVIPPLITHLQVSTDPFAGLALPQQASMVMSSETTGAYVPLYANLVAHVEEWGEPTSASKLTWKTWVAFFMLATWLALVWRLCPKLLEGAR